jgi:hypothetical protein
MPEGIAPLRPSVVRPPGQAAVTFGRDMPTLGGLIRLNFLERRLGPIAAIMSEGRRIRPAGNRRLNSVRRSSL